LDRCPCCGADAGATPHDELRFVCDVCGGPRVPRLDRSIQYSGREAALLRKADGARKARAGWRAAAIAGALLLPLVLLVFSALLLLFGAGAGLIVTALAATAPVAAFVAFAALRAGSRGQEIGPALDAAWLSAATDVARQTRGLTAPALARTLGIAEPQAEELMALLDVNAAVGAPPPGAPQVRIDPGAAAQPARIADFASSEEEALAEQIEARARARLGPGAGKP
jgi:hypothetical protein